MGTSLFGVTNSPPDAGVFLKQEYAKKTRSAAFVKFARSGMGTGNTRPQSTKKSPTTTKSTSGRTFPHARTTAVRAPDFTPSTLIHVKARSGRTIVAYWPKPERAPGQRYPTARAKNTASPAIEAMRAIHVIHPTSNPTKSPKAARV